MFISNSTNRTSLWATTDSHGNLIEIASANSRQVLTGKSPATLRTHVAGIMTVRVTIWQKSADLDTEDVLYRALDALIDNLNDLPGDTAQLLDAERIRIHDRFHADSLFICSGPSEWTARIAWTGEPVSEDGPAHVYGSTEWQIDRGVPARSAGW